MPPSWNRTAWVVAHTRPASTGHPAPSFRSGGSCLESTLFHSLLGVLAAPLVTMGLGIVGTITPGPGAASACPSRSARVSLHRSWFAKTNLRAFSCSLLRGVDGLALGTLRCRSANGNLGSTGDQITLQFKMAALCVLIGPCAVGPPPFCLLRHEAQLCVGRTMSLIPLRPTV